MCEVFTKSHGNEPTIIKIDQRTLQFKKKTMPKVCAGFLYRQI